MKTVDDVVNGIRQIQQDAMDAKATIAHHCDQADVLAVIIDRADSLASAIEAGAPSRSNAEWFIEGIRAIESRANGAPGDDPLDALIDIANRARTLLIAIEGPSTVGRQLAELVTPRNVGSPDAPDSYPGSVDDVADEIAAFIDQLDASRSATGLRALVLERLRAMEAEHARKHYEVLLSQVLRTVTDEHLYPALRAAGVPNPEGFRVELHGKWEP